MRILVVEDDIKISDLLTKGLVSAGYAVTEVGDGEAAFQMAQAQKFDLLIVDLMLPKLDGLSLIEKLRDNRIQTPVLILSAKRSVDERISGLQRGGDDYLTKPFSFPELLARCQALLRRSQRADQGPTQLAQGNLKLDLVTRELTREGKKIELQAREFLLLELFLRNPERVFTKVEILEKIWDYHFVPQTNVVDVLVCRLRNKLDKDFSKKTIRTIRGIGYVFKEV